MEFMTFAGPVENALGLAHLIENGHEVGPINLVMAVALMLAGLVAGRFGLEWADQRCRIIGMLDSFQGSILAPAPVTPRAWGAFLFAAAGLLVAILSPHDPVKTSLAAIAIWFMFILGIIDWRTYVIDDAPVFFLLFLGLGAASFGATPVSVGMSTLGAALGFFCLEFYRRSGTAIGLAIPGRRAAVIDDETEMMGSGDPLFLAAIGAWTGPVGALATAVTAALIGSGILVLRSARERRNAFADPIAFGPYLAIGGALTVLLALPGGGPLT